MHTLAFLGTICMIFAAFLSRARVTTRAFSSPATTHHQFLSKAYCLSTMSSASVNGDVTNGDGAEYPLEMTEDERYLFDLNGYLVVRNVLTADQVRRANDIIDAHAHEMVERSDAALRNAVQGTKMYGKGPARKDLGGVLEWGADESRIFKSILAHPRLVPL